MHDPEAFAEMVVLTIKSALAPVLERLAVSEQCNRDLQSRVAELSGIRDRVTTMEAKSAIPLPTPEPVTVDLTPILERVAAAEARISVIGDVRDRLTVVETKALEPVAVPDPVEPDLSPVLDRVSKTESLVAELEPWGDRIAALEAKAAAPPDTSMIDRAVAALEARLAAAELRAELKAGETAPILSSIADLTKDIGAMRERVAVVEVRAQVPGPAGQNGADGKDGKDGADGLGFDDLMAVQTDERSFTIKAQRGDRVKDIGTARFPIQIQRGVYTEGKSYEQGDVVTWGGSQWHCDAETTTKPGDGSKGWTLVVKRGRDGKDGRDGRDPGAVVKVS